MKILLPPMSDARLEQLHQSAPNDQFIVARSEAEALAMVAEVDATYGYCNSDLLKAAPRLRWVQVASAGVELYPLLEMHARGITFTNAKGIYGTQLADHILALSLAFRGQLPFL